MKKLISIILSLCLLLTFAAAENAPAAQETGEKTAEELYEAGAKAAKAGEDEKALEDYRKSADMGFAKAQHALGYMYFTGQGVEKDFQKAAEYYQLAADLGELYVLNGIGNMYENGYGVEQNYGKAMEYYRQAADWGYATALLCIGYLVSRGVWRGEKHGNSPGILPERV